MRRDNNLVYPSPRRRGVQGDACERHNPQRRFIFLVFPPLVYKWSHFQRGEFTWEKNIKIGLTLNALEFTCEFIIASALQETSAL